MSVKKIGSKNMLGGAGIAHLSNSLALAKSNFNARIDRISP